jgi:DNA-binding NarL/FixJ family response regulator
MPVCIQLDLFQHQRANKVFIMLPRVILADDHTILVEAFHKLLEPHCNIVATVSDGRALVETAKKLNPEVVIADIGMPLMNGLEAGLRLKEQMRTVKLIFLTVNHDASLAAEAMRRGASAYLLKSCAATELIRAIQLAVKGQSYVSPEIARGMEREFINNPEPVQRAKTLTPRQREVVLLLAEGKSMKQVASVLNVTPRTVAFHKYRVMQQLNLQTTADLIQFAIKSKICVSE